MNAGRRETGAGDHRDGDGFIEKNRTERGSDRDANSAECQMRRVDQAGRYQRITRRLNGHHKYSEQTPCDYFTRVPKIVELDAAESEGGAALQRNTGRIVKSF